jgi:hypothetical protein
MTNIVNFRQKQHRINHSHLTTAIHTPQHTPYNLVKTKHHRTIKDMSQHQTGRVATIRIHGRQQRNSKARYLTQKPEFLNLLIDLLKALAFLSNHRPTLTRQE